MKNKYFTCYLPPDDTHVLVWCRLFITWTETYKSRPFRTTWNRYFSTPSSIIIPKQLVAWTARFIHSNVICYTRSYDSLTYQYHIWNQLIMQSLSTHNNAKYMVNGVTLTPHRIHVLLTIHTSPCDVESVKSEKKLLHPSSFFLNLLWADLSCLWANFLNACTNTHLTCNSAH